MLIKETLLPRVGSWIKKTFSKNFREPITSFRLIVLITLFFDITSNTAFWQHTFHAFPLNAENLLELLSLLVLTMVVLIFVLTLINTRHTLKPVIITLLIVTSLATYYINTYNIVIDATMIQNILETSVAEASDLLNFTMFMYLFIFGILPSIWVYKVQVKRDGWSKELLSRIKIVLASIAIVAAMGLVFTKFYISYFKEHKSVHFYFNPMFFIYSIEDYIEIVLNSEQKEIEKIGMDAKVVSTSSKKKLVIFVVGETARADHFSLNGYPRETNPLLAKADVINFSDFSSCGTTTAVSVPCMFSKYGRSDYSYEKGHNTESLMDVFNYAGIDLLWRDNNSDSKGVALRVNFEDFKGTKIKGYYDHGETRDEAMLVTLQDFIDKQKNDIFIVLHHMGSHGPAYYKRYPKAFEKFTPICETNLLDECTDETIANTYDNTILYTDYFLSQTIKLLKKNEKKFETAMMYVSDHGESLGEAGMYLHGLPYFIAPKAQTHVPAVMWFGDSWPINKDRLKELKDQTFSHDNLFHSLLGLMRVQTSLYDKSLDIFKK